MWHEAGSGAANAGVQFTVVGAGGVYTAADLAAARKPAAHMLYPPTTLAVVENTHNRRGGLVFPQTDAVAVCEAARVEGLSTYCDGARLMNAAAASSTTAAELAAPFDLVSLSLSKGLGAPVGSLLAGSRQLIDRAVRYRRMYGGAMRQAGILAEAGSYALAHNVERLADDHDNARHLAASLATSDVLALEPASVETNIVVFALRAQSAALDAAGFVAACRARGVLLNALGARAVRAVTHLDVDRAACERAAAVMIAVAAGR